MRTATEAPVEGPRSLRGLQSLQSGCEERAGSGAQTRAKNTRQGGFTLVEMMVALSISAIVIAIAVTFIIFSMNILSRTETQSVDKQLAEGSADFIKDRLLYAHSIEIVRANKPPSSFSVGEILFIGKVDPATGELLIANEGKLYYMRFNEAAPTEISLGADNNGNGLALAFRAIVDMGGTMRTPKAFELTAKTIRDGNVVHTSKKTFNLYDANLAPGAEPQASADIDSWHDAGFAQNDSDQLFYLLINATP